MSNKGTDNKNFMGKYRGKVLNNIDPKFLGRLLIEIPSIPGNQMNWAMPCVPYAGPEVGFFAMPPIDANVWVEFEGGDPNYPIWVGCFWAEGQAPLGGLPEIKVFKSDFNTLILNDIPDEGGIIINSIDPAVTDPCTLMFNSEGITLEIPTTSISMTTETITALSGNVTITAEEAIELVATEDISITASGAIEITATEDVSVEAGAAVEITAGADAAISAGGAVEVSGGGDVSIEAGGACEVTAGADVAVTAGAACELTAGADVAITAGMACEMTAGVDIAITAGLACEVTAGADVAITAVGACEVTAVGVAITGATEVTGVLLIDGDIPMMLPA